MTVKLTEDQVLDIHTSYHANGGRCKFHTLMKRHGLTVNEVYTVLRMDLRSGLRRAVKGHKFVSWDPQQRQEKKKSVGRIQRENRSRFFGG